jgi:hypothetical protein
LASAAFGKKIKTNLGTAKARGGARSAGFFGFNTRRKISFASFARDSFFLGFLSYLYEPSLVHPWLKKLFDFHAKATPSCLRVFV